MTTAVLRHDATYVQRVYAWFTLGVALCSVGSFFALTFGAPVSTLFKGQSVEVPPAVALVMAHPFIFGFGFLGFALVTAAFRGQHASVPLYIGFTSFSGLFIGPSIFLAELAAQRGETLSAHPVRDAGILTIGSFFALTCYAAWSKRDFSSWGAALSMGLWLLIGVMFLNLFFGSTVVSLATSSVAVIIFGGFIIHDTQRILQNSHGEDAMIDAMNMFLNVLNMFLHLLRLLMGSSSSRD